MLFAGVTVAISVTGLAFFGLDFVTKLGIGSALGVLTTVLIANSLLIAVLAKLGHKIDRWKVPFLRPIDDSEAAREKTLIARWGRFVTAHAKAVFVVVLLAVVGLASTSGLVRLGASDQGTQPTNQTARRAYDLLAEGFGPGFNGPIPIVVDVNGDEQAPQRIYEGVKRLNGVASVGEPQFNDPKTVAIVFVTPASKPQDEATDELVDRLRDDVVPAATQGSQAVAYVSGLTAAFKDIADRIYERLPLFLLYIIGVTFIVLAMAFRSIVISLTAAITTILSAFVGFGVLTLVVQEGHLLSLTGLDTTGPIETFVPPIAFAILFGLSMDYMVFLMSRIREEHVHGLDDAGGGRARHQCDRPRHRRGGDHHGHGLRRLHPDLRPDLEGVRPAAGDGDPDRRARREDDAGALVPDAHGRAFLVHPPLARPAAPQHHDRAAARSRRAWPRRRAGSRARDERGLNATEGAEPLRAPPPPTRTPDRRGSRPLPARPCRVRRRRVTERAAIRAATGRSRTKGEGACPNPDGCFLSWRSRSCCADHGSAGRRRRNAGRRVRRALRPGRVARGGPAGGRGAGGQIVKENTDVGVATVTSGNATFLADVAAQSAVGARRRRAQRSRRPADAARGREA